MDLSITPGQDDAASGRCGTKDTPFHPSSAARAYSGSRSPLEWSARSPAGPLHQRLCALVALDWVWPWSYRLLGPGLEVLSAPSGPFILVLLPVPVDASGTVPAWVVCVVDNTVDNGAKVLA